jgi:hypothetical protein
LVFGEELVELWAYLLGKGQASNTVYHGPVLMENYEVIRVFTAGMEGGAEHRKSLLHCCVLKYV